MSVPIERLNYEAAALDALSSLPLNQMVKGVHIDLPRVQRYDGEHRLLIMSDVGGSLLKEMYSCLSAADIARIGHALGVWLATMHSLTRTVNIAPNGKPVAKSFYRWAYEGTANIARENRFNDDVVKFCQDIDQKYGLMLSNDDECICHGDFWPRNVLVRRSAVARSGGNQDDSIGHETIILAIVDWEMCRRGTGATDVGQFLAEAWLLDRYQDEKGLRKAFWGGYSSQSGRSCSDKEISSGEMGVPSWIKRMYIHMGVHLAYSLTSALWANSQEETKEIIKVGHRLMEGDILAMED